MCPLDVISTSKSIFSFDMDFVFLRERMKKKHNCRQMALVKHPLCTLYGRKKALPRTGLKVHEFCT